MSIRRKTFAWVCHLLSFVLFVSSVSATGLDRPFAILHPPLQPCQLRIQCSTKKRNRTHEPMQTQMQMWPPKSPWPASVTCKRDHTSSPSKHDHTSSLSKRDHSSSPSKRDHSSSPPRKRNTTRSSFGKGRWRYLFYWRKTDQTGNIFVCYIFSSSSSLLLIFKTTRSCIRVIVHPSINESFARWISTSCCRVSRVSTDWITGFLKFGSIHS